MKIQFSTENAAYSDYDYPHMEIARSIRKVAEQVENRETSGTVRDANGNTVGKWEV